MPTSRHTQLLNNYKVYCYSILLYTVYNVGNLISFSFFTHIYGYYSLTVWILFTSIKMFCWISIDTTTPSLWMQEKQPLAMETLTSISRVQEWLPCTVILKTRQEPLPSFPMAIHAPWMAWQSQSLYDCLKVNIWWMVWRKNPRKCLHNVCYSFCLQLHMS